MAQIVTSKQKPASLKKGCGIIFDCNGEILLLKRSASKKFEPNMWNLPGGHCEANEEPATSAARELYEESGIKIASTDATLVGSKILETGTEFEINYFVFYYKTSIRPKITLNNESSGYGWFTLEEIKNMTLARGEMESFKLLDKWNKSIK